MATAKTTLSKEVESAQEYAAPVHNAKMEAIRQRVHAALNSAYWQGVRRQHLSGDAKTLAELMDTKETNLVREKYNRGLHWQPFADQAFDEL